MRLSRSMKARNDLLILLCIIIAAVSIRLYHINYDLPFVYDQDEPIFVILALRMLKNHDLNPHWFGHPATTLMYLLAALDALIFIIGRSIGFFHSAEDFRQFYYNNPTIFYITGRLVSLFFGVTTIGLVFKIGLRLRDLSTGAIAATILTLTPIHISLSQTVRADTLMVFLIVLAFWFCLEILEKQHLRSYLGAGFIAGLAAVTKYPAIVISVTIALSHFLAIRSLRLANHGKLLGCAGACFAGAFVGSPFIFLDFRTVLKDVIQEARPEHLGATGEGFFRNLLWYLGGPLPDALSVAGLVFVCLGVVFCVYSKRNSLWVLLSFPIAFLLFISSLNLRWERWILPAIPFLCLLLAIGATQLMSYFSDRKNRVGAAVTAAILVIFVLGPLAYRAFIQLRVISSPFTSTLARQWMLENVPSGSRVLIEVYGPTLPSGLFDVFVVDQAGNLVRAQNSNGEVAPQWEIGRMKDTNELETQKIEYVVLSERDRYSSESNKYAREIATYEKTAGPGRLAFEVQGTQAMRRGPKIQIFELARH